VTDPADCVYPVGLEFTFYGPQQIFYSVDADETRGATTDYNPAQSERSFHYSYELKNVDLVQDICRDFYVEVSVRNATGDYLNLTGLAADMMEKYGLNDAPIRADVHVEAGTTQSYVVIQVSEYIYYQLLQMHFQTANTTIATSIKY
jgi:hypothetical protein